MNNLNEFYQKLKQKFNLLDIRFHFENTSEFAPKLCSEILPFSKVFVLYSSHYFIKNRGLFLNEFEKYNIRCINLVEDINFYKNFNVKANNSILEDVRAIITFEEELVEYALELAKELSITCIISPKRFPPFVFSKLNVNKEKKEKGINSLQVVINCNNAKGDEEFSLLYSKIISILDIKLNLVLNTIALVDEELDRFSNLLEFGLKEYLVEEQNNFGFLFMQRIKLELIEYAINYQPKAKNCEQAKLILSLLSRKGETENFPPDYRHRAKLYSEKTNESYFTVLERVLNQIKELKKNQYRLAIFMPIIKKLAKNHLEKYKPHFKKYKKEHIETKPNREILKEINYLAEDKRLINCLTILREEGKI